MKVKIILSGDIHRKLEVVAISFAYNSNLADILKQNFAVHWSQTKKHWWIERSVFDFKKFKAIFSTLAEIELHEKKEERNEKVELGLPYGYLEKLEQKRYSPQTIKIYTKYFNDFRSHFEERNLLDITMDEINAYILDLIQTKDISHSQQNQRINAIKYYYEQVLGREKEYIKIERPLRQKRLPDVLSKDEVCAMITGTHNLKHKCLIAVIYSCGLRRGEAINLKLKDIDSKRMVVKIVDAKGKKDRYVQLADSVLKVLRLYYNKEKPKTWLFEGQEGQQYSATSIYNTIKKAARIANIKKRVYPHILRHSFATHHLEQGTDLRYIQVWLGHSSSKTTEIYTQVSQQNFIKFKNPIDDIEFGDG